MSRAWFRFYAELNDFLPADRRAVSFPLAFEGHQTVKHLIESLGVPHTEVDLILVNGEASGFARAVEDGDRISVYPVFEAFDIEGLTRVRPKPLRRPRFVLDAHLGRLASHLRLLGFDALYRNDSSDEELAAVSAAEHRILLTRDRQLLMRRAVTHGYSVRETHPHLQLLEVLRRFDLAGRIKPFVRCLRCNATLDPAGRDEVAASVPPRSFAACDEFRRCSGCGKVYWNGSHHRRMKRFVAQVLDALGPAPR